MLKSELIEALAIKTGVPIAESERYLNTLVNTIYEELRKGGEVKISGFGTFSVFKAKDTLRRNPRTKEMMKVPSHKRPKFVCGEAFKATVKL